MTSDERPISRALLLALIWISPLVAGGHRPVAWALNGIIVGVALCAQGLSRRPGRTTPNFIGQASFWISALLVAVVAYTTFQATSLSPTGLHHPIWSLVRRLGAEGAISLNPSASWSTIGWVSTLSVAVLAVKVGRLPEGVYMVLQAIVGITASIALFGLIAEALDAETLGFSRKTAHLGWLTGTFANRNHAATFFSFGAVAGLILFASGQLFPIASTATFSVFRGRLRLKRLHSYSWLLLAAFLLAALLLTGSRGGVGAGLVGIAFTVCLLALQKNGFGLRFTMLALISCAVALTASSIAGIGVFARGDTADSNLARMSLYREAVRAIADRLWFGHGAGTYPDVQPLYHSQSTSTLIWSHAHSTYLEVFATLGLPFAAAALAGIGFVGFRLLAAAARGQKASPAAVAACATLLIAALHAAVDYSLQIQSVAIVLSTVVGLALGEGEGRAEPRTLATQRRWGNGAALLGGGLASICILFSVRTAAIEAGVPPTIWLAGVRAPVHSVPVPSWTRFAAGWLADRLSDRDLVQARLATCRDQMRTERRDQDGQTSTAERLSCLGVINSGLRAAPVSAELWLIRAEYLLTKQGLSAPVLEALKNSYITGAREEGAIARRLPVAAKLWPELPSEVKALVRQDLGVVSFQAVIPLVDEFLISPAHQARVSRFLAEAAPPALRRDFTEQLRVRADRRRRAVDRRLAALHLPECEQNGVRAYLLTVAAAGEAFKGPPVVRLWVNGSVLTEIEVGADSKRSNHVDASRPLHAPDYQIVLPQDVPILSIEIEFPNDLWASDQGDRNLEIRGLKLDQAIIPLDRFSVPVGSEATSEIGVDRIRMSRNGTVRLAFACTPDETSTTGFVPF